MFFRQLVGGCSFCFEIKMFYELTIAISSVIISFIVYLSFFKKFQNDRNRNETESDDDEIILDERVDLESKELLLVNVVRIESWMLVQCGRIEHCE